jgi:hypothetical protein
MGPGSALATLAWPGRRWWVNRYLARGSVAIDPRGRRRAIVAIFFQKKHEFVPVKPAPARVQAGEKFEFAVCENRHRSAGMPKSRTVGTNGETLGRYFWNLSPCVLELRLQAAADALHVWGIATLLFAIWYR